MVDDYCTTVTESFPLALFHMLITALIISRLLLQTFVLGFSHGLTSGSLPSIFTLTLPSRSPYQFLLIVSVLGYSNTQGDHLITITIYQSEALLPASLWPLAPIYT